MPYLTTLENSKGEFHTILLQRKLDKGILLDGIITTYIVRAVEFVETVGRDFSLSEVRV